MVRIAHSVFTNGAKSSLSNPIIIIHGLFGSKQNWQRLYTLSSHYSLATSNPEQRTQKLFIYYKIINTIFLSLGKSISAQLSRSVVALDMRNHGESPHTTLHSYGEMSQDVVEFVQSNGWNQVDLIGKIMITIS